MIRRDESPRPGRIDDINCIRCLVVTPSEDLDRLLWCENCVALARRRALRIGLLSGAGLAVLLAIYVWFGIQPNLALIPAGWLLMLVVAFYLGSRVAREVAYGVMRWQNRPAVEAHPPA
ncbi:hypothetical protein BH23GEM11_BH23GEM11_05470 [soil metagenome]